jgi:hypothetical protein
LRLVILLTAADSKNHYFLLMAKKWSQKVTDNSDALDLEEGIFTWKDPRKIALSLKRSAEQSTRRKTDPYRSAMSMLTFYMNRSGRNLAANQIKTLEKAFGRA